MEIPIEIPSSPQPEAPRPRRFADKLKRQPQDPERQKAKKTFDQQFATRVSHEVDGGIIDTVHLKPTAVDGNPVIYTFGWMGMIDDCKPYLKAMYDGGKETFAFNQPTFRPEATEQPLHNSKYTERNANGIVKIAGQNGLEVVDLLGHSEGASNTLRAAQKLIEQGIRVEEIVLVNPTGAGNPSKEAITSHISQHPISNIDSMPSKDYETRRKEKEGVLQRAAIQMIKTELSRSIRNPRLLPSFLRLNVRGGLSVLKHRHLKEEGRQISQSNMADLIKPLIEGGVNISILQADDDPMLNTTDINGDVQKAAQAVRQARAQSALGEVDRELRTDDGSIDAKKRSDLYEQKMQDIRRNEEDDMLVTSATGKPGHLFTGYDNDNRIYIPHAVDMLNKMRVRRTLRKFSSAPPALPATTQ